MKRLALLVAAALAASAVPVVLPGSGSASHPGSRTFVLIEVEGTFSFVDHPPRARNRRNPSVSAGDTLVFNNTLLDQANARVGALDAFCMATRSGRTFGRARFQCSGTFTLRDGTLALSAAFRGSQENPVIAVVGGTGAYEGARGSVTSRNLPRDRTEDTVHISQ
jgi:Dirigent-like protein